MKTLLEYLTKLIVKNPADAKVVEEQTSDWTILRLTVAPQDMGLAIGKGGKIISALRNLVRVKAIKEGKRVNVELVESPSAGETLKQVFDREAQTEAVQGDAASVPGDTGESTRSRLPL